MQETLTETADGRHRAGPPKTKAGRRTVAIPPHVTLEVEAHLAERVGLLPTRCVFPAAEGKGYLRRSNFTRRVWKPATKKVGVSLHFHDLRHSGLTWTAATGATLAELMRRAGHASPRAALIYQHATEDRDRILAHALSELHKRARSCPLTVASPPRRRPRYNEWARCSSGGKCTRRALRTVSSRVLRVRAEYHER